MSLILKMAKIITLSVLILFGLTYWFLYLRPEALFRERLSGIEAQFQNHKEFYIERLVNLHTSDGNLPVLSQILLNSDGAAVGANVFEYLIYDQSDEIAKIPQMRSSRWAREAQQNLGSVASATCKTTVKQIQNHIYAAIVTC